MPTVDTMLLNN